MKIDKKQILIRELTSLGSYWRNDWSDFDGRTLRNQLGHITRWYADDNNESDFTDFTELLASEE